jgi:hypothetical protein
MKLVAEVWRGFGIVGKIGMIVLALGALFVLSGTILSGKVLFYDLPNELDTLRHAVERVNRNIEIGDENAVLLEGLVKDVTEFNRTMCEKGLSDCR